MGQRCHVCKIEPEKPKQCMQCKKTIYCSTDCQKADWPKHKRTTCTKPAILHKADKVLKQLSRPGGFADRLNKYEDSVWAERRRNPQPVFACDSCFRTFRGRPVEFDTAPGDAGDVFKHCTECDFTICEDCTRPENQGIPFFDRPNGTCRCPTSNYGVDYCLSDPLWLHGDGRKQYYGDRHPSISDSRYDDGAFEERARPCKNCGVIARCLKKQYLKDTGLAEESTGSRSIHEQVIKRNDQIFGKPDGRSSDNSGDRA